LILFLSSTANWWTTINNETFTKFRFYQSWSVLPWIPSRPLLAYWYPTILYRSEDQPFIAVCRSSMPFPFLRISQKHVRSNDFIYDDLQWHHHLLPRLLLFVIEYDFKTSNIRFTFHSNIPQCQFDLVINNPIPFEFNLYECFIHTVLSAFLTRSPNSIIRNLKDFHIVFFLTPLLIFYNDYGHNVCSEWNWKWYYVGCFQISRIIINHCIRWNNS
jgi:hypothetical protein